MARGWESKSVEAQQSEPFERPVPREPAEARDARQKRESLELSRTRVRRELGEARSPVHRTALENALRYLDEEIGKLQ